MGAFEMLACMCQPHARSYPTAMAACKPRSAPRATSSPGCDPAACKGMSLAFSKQFDSLCCGLWAWCIYTRKGVKEMKSEAGQLLVELVDPRSEKKFHHLVCSSFCHETCPLIHVATGKLQADETVPWKGAFRAYNLLVARWGGQSILKWGWLCSLLPSRSSKVQLLGDGAIKEEICQVEMLDKCMNLCFRICAENITPWHLQ